MTTDNPKREREFLRLWAAQTVSILGSSTASFGTALWIYDATGNSGDLAWLTFAHLAPLIYLSIFAGYYFKQVNLNWLISGKGEPYILDAKTRTESESKLLLLMKQDPELIEKLTRLRPDESLKIELAKKVLELDDIDRKSVV